MTLKNNRLFCDRNKYEILCLMCRIRLNLFTVFVCVSVQYGTVKLSGSAAWKDMMDSSPPPLVLRAAYSGSVA